MFVFTATPKIKHSKGRSDTMSEGGEGKLFLVIHTVVCIPYEQMFYVWHGDEYRCLKMSVCLTVGQISRRAFFCFVCLFVCVF